MLTPSCHHAPRGRQALIDTNPPPRAPADKREIYAVDLVRSTLNTASPIDPKLLRDDVTAPKPPPVPEKPPPNPEDSDPFLKYSVVPPPTHSPPSPSPHARTLACTR